MKRWYVEEEVTIGNWRRTAMHPRDENEAVAMARRAMATTIHNHRASAVEIPDAVQPPLEPQDTRRIAYIASLGDPAGNRVRVAQLLRASGIKGMTCDEIEVRDGMQFSTAGSIILGLRDDGWVEQSRIEPTRRTRRNSRACVWVMREAQLPEDQRIKVRRGKGRYKQVCEQAYALMGCDAWEEARHILALAMGKDCPDDADTPTG